MMVRIKGEKERGGVGELMGFVIVGIRIRILIGM
jgi:hypothetical protein